MKDSSICLKLEKDQIKLLKYAAGWEQTTMSGIVSGLTVRWLEDWKKREPEKYNFWREHYDQQSDHQPVLQPGCSPERETTSSR